MGNDKKEPYRILLQGGEGEITEKKSRFLATVRKVDSEAEAIIFIEEMKKKYWDARHNCSAYVIGSKAELTRCSDDNEPGGTAGKPMLEVLLGSGIRNAAVVVTRYFGGVLLGTGGLVRAYSQAVREGLSHCKTAVMRYGYSLNIETDYNGIGKILYILEQMGIAPEHSEYTDSVHLQIIVPEEKVEILCSRMTETTNGKVHIERLKEAYFIDKESSL